MRSHDEDQYEFVPCYSDVAERELDRHDTFDDVARRALATSDNLELYVTETTMTQPHNGTTVVMRAGGDDAPYRISVMVYDYSSKIVITTDNGYRYEASFSGWLDEPHDAPEDVLALRYPALVTAHRTLLAQGKNASANLLIDFALALDGAFDL